MHIFPYAAHTHAHNCRFKLEQNRVRYTSNPCTGASRIGENGEVKREKTLATEASDKWAVNIKRLKKGYK